MLIDLPTSSLSHLKDTNLLNSCKVVKAFGCAYEFKELEKFGDYNVSMYIHTYTYIYIHIYTYTYMYIYYISHTLCVQMNSNMDGVFRVLDKYVFKKSQRSKHRSAYEITENMWKRESSDDIGIYV